MPTISYTTRDGRRIEVEGRIAGHKGYAAPPGTGPKGETCGTCKHHVATHGSEGRSRKNYYKCDLVVWTFGPATDIRMRSPACKLWERRVEEVEE